MIMEYSLWLLEQCIELTLEHNWNVHFHVPDLYNEIPRANRPVIRWYIWNTIRGLKNE